MCMMKNKIDTLSFYESVKGCKKKTTANNQVFNILQ